MYIPLRQSVLNGKKRKSDFLFDVCPLFTQRNKQGWKQSYADETEFEMRNFHIFLCPCHEMAGAYKCIALPLFVILSFCHYVIIHPQSLSQQPLHTFSSSFIYGYILWLKGWLLIWFRSDESLEICLLNFENKWKFTLWSLSQPLHTFNSNSLYGCILQLHSLSLNLPLVWWLLTEMCP